MLDIGDDFPCVAHRSCNIWALDLVFLSIVWFYGLDYIKRTEEGL